MDELELLSRHRPDVAPPTDAERATARAALMPHVMPAAAPDATGDTVVDLTASPRRTRRRLVRAVALVGTAAAVALVALTVGTTGSGGPAPLRIEPTAAEQLVAIAEVVEGSNPYPAGPYSVESHQVMTSVGGGIDDHSSEFDATLYRINENDTIARCDGGVACFARIGSSATNDLIPHDGTPTEVRDGVDAQIDADAGDVPTGALLTWVRLTLIAEELANPALTPGVRAELLRIVAETADLSVEEDVESALGLAGTRFVAATPTGELTLIIDPDDGYLLEVSEVGTTRVVTAEIVDGEPVMTEGGQADTSSVLSYARPVAADPLPADIQDLADDIASVTPQIEAGVPSGGCAGATGGNPGGPSTNWGLDIPEGLSALHCWLP